MFVFQAFYEIHFVKHSKSWNDYYINYLYDLREFT